MFSSKNLAFHFVSALNTQKFSNTAVVQVSSLSVLHDHTKLERQEIRRSYADLDERIKKGRSNIALRNRNGVPYVTQIKRTTKSEH